MEQVRCTNCGSTAIIPDGSGEFCKCSACGSTFNVPRAQAFSKVQLDRSQDVRAWREYLAKQLKLQQDSNKARDYTGVKLFAQKILSVLPDDFCAMFYCALADRYADNDVAFTDFLSSASFDGVTPDELKEVVTALVSSVEPKYLDGVRAFIFRAYPQNYSSFEPQLERNIKTYIQKLKYARTGDRDVFICHRTAAPDQDIADAICTRLEERGLRCWIAPRNILAGSQNYERDIIKGVQNCRLFLLVSSFKSIYSDDCETELKAAVLDGKALYSYRIDDTPYDGAFERALSAVQWLDAQDDPYGHLEQLVIDVKGILARDEREKADLEEKRRAARELERIEAEKRRAAEQERLDRLERIVAGGIPASAPSAVPVRSRLKRAEVELAAGAFDRAQEIADEALDIDPECALAWWVLILADYRMRSDDELISLGKDVTAHRYYANAQRFAAADPQMQRRIDRVASEFNMRVVRTVTADLDEAERYFAADDFNNLELVLSRCDDVFKNESGAVYTKFPDLASKYYWLKLWNKYGQSPLVCVEDITREREYAMAVKCASPAQSDEYAKKRELVSRNAQMFLRERSKNPDNDSKLVDYLADNRGILPTDVYNGYSSLMYYRKMLKALNMTEDELRASTVDISTDENFMLAQSFATPEQKQSYDNLLAAIDFNRSSEQNRQYMREQAAAATKAHTEKSAKQRKLAAMTIRIVTAALSYVFAILGIVLFAVSVPLDLVSIDSDGVEALLFLSGVMRIVCDAMLLGSKSRKGLILTVSNLVSGIILFIITAAMDMMHVDAVLFRVMLVVAFILEAIKLRRNATSKK